jgi:hypothetical protein
MAITWTDVTNLDASLSTVPVAAQTAIIADTYAILSAERWGTRLDLAVKYLAAHTGALLIRGGGAGPAGPVTAEALGDASRSYASWSVSGALGDLELTSWGLRFKLLLRGLQWMTVL